MDVGQRGLFVEVFSRFGLSEITGIEGFVGSWIVLTLFTYPYVQLICSSALRNLDSTVEDAARVFRCKTNKNVYKCSHSKVKKTYDIFVTLSRFVCYF